MADLDLGPERIRVVVPEPPAPVRTPLPTVPGVNVVPVAGSPGATGPAGGEAFVHTQAVPAATWSIAHNLGRRAPVLLFVSDDPDEPVFTDVTYPDDDHIVVEWPAPTTGTAHI